MMCGDLHPPQLSSFIAGAVSRRLIAGCYTLYATLWTCSCPLCLETLGRTAPGLHFNHPLSVHPISTGGFNGAASDAPDSPQRACKHGAAGFTRALVFAAARPCRPRRSLQTFYMPRRMFRWRSASQPDGLALNCDVY